MEKREFHAKKSLGQHFLANRGVCARIVSLLAARPVDHILEIGPGAGALSELLLAEPAAGLMLLEKDPRWARKMMELARGRANVILVDALKFPWEKLSGSWRIIGNLPYNVASPLIWDILSRCRALARAVFMVQKEVGLRLAARPGSRAYGALSVWVQSHAEVSIELTLAPGSFRPPPKVDSAVLTFRPLPESERPERPDLLKKLLDMTFQKRRKQLGSIFGQAKMDALLEGLGKLGIDPTLRPENLDCALFRKLSLYLEASEAEGKFKAVL